MVKQPVALIAILALLAQDAAFAAKTNVAVSWDELSGILVEKRISTVLPDGTRLSGEVLAVRPESLVIDVHKTSNKKLYAKGQNEIPRASVKQVRIIRERNAAMRIVGGILGAVGGVMAVGALAVATDSAAVLVPCLLVIIPLSAVGGYYAGKLADRTTTRVVVRD